MRQLFQRASEATAIAVGSAEVFVIAVAVVLVWAATGPVFAYSDTWQLIINTGTTIVTFLMVFLIQATQNRDTRILNLKLDELLRALEGARTNLVNLDQLSDDELKRLQAQFKALGNRVQPLIGDDLAAVEGELSTRSAKNHRGS